MGEFFGFGEDLKHKHPPKPQANQPGDQEAKSTRQPQYCPSDLHSIGLKVSKVSFACADETNFDLIFALLRIGTHHQVINIKGIIEGIITDILKGFFKSFFKRIFKGIIKAFFAGILKTIFESIFESILNGITKGFFKGIILVSLRVIDGGFSPSNEFLTLRRGLRHIRYIFLSDRLLELGIGCLFIAAALNPAQPPPPQSILALV